MLPEAPRRLEVRSTPTSLVFRARLSRGGLLVSFSIVDGEVRGGKIATATTHESFEAPDDDVELIDHWHRTQWVTGVATRTLWSAYRPTSGEIQLAELFLRLDGESVRLHGLHPLIDDFESGDWSSACSLAEEAAAPAPSWFEPLRLALVGRVGDIIEAATSAGDLVGHMASFRGVARRELNLLEAALADLKSATANLTASERANHYTMIGEICHLLGRNDEAIELIAWSVTRSADDEAFIRSTTLLLRFGGYGEAERALESRTAQGAAPPEVWLLRAKLALWCGRPADARKFVGEAHGGDDHQITLALGIAAALEGKDDDALADFSQLESAGDREAHSWSAELLHRRGDIERASEHLELAGLTAQSPVHTLLRSVVYDEVVELSGSAQLKALGWEDEREHTALTAAEALRVFQGNRGPEPSRTPTASPVLSASELSQVLTPPGDTLNTSRLASSGLLKEIRHRPVSEVHTAFAELQRKFPESPHPHCYWGELLLWEGRYDEAFAAFQGNRPAQLARWGYVGRAAVHVHHRRFDEAIIEFEMMSAIYAPVPGATTHVYLGELHRLRGEHDLALKELAIATNAKPLRLGAWLNTVLCLSARGESERALDRYGRLSARWPNLFWHASRQAGAEHAAPGESLVEICEAALELMRGNRSSHLHTFFDSDGAMRFTFDSTLWSHLKEARSFLRIGALEQLLLGTEAQT
ncbi:MAG: tetratricopeptide (TPR) repeat protein [Bradymonadia bacterium]